MRRPLRLRFGGWLAQKKQQLNDEESRLEGCRYAALDGGASPEQADHIARLIVAKYAHWPSNEATARVMVEDILDLVP